jgi:hypothetical protein
MEAVRSQKRPVRGRRLEDRSQEGLLMPEETIRIQTVQDIKRDRRRSGNVTSVRRSQ